MAYSMDDDEVNGVKLHKIYDAMWLQQTKQNSTTSHKIKQWSNRVCWPIEINSERSDEKFRVL